MLDLDVSRLEYCYCEQYVIDLALNAINLKEIDCGTAKTLHAVR